MKLIIIDKRRVKQFLLFTTLLIFALVYSGFKDNDMLSVFKKNTRLIPIYCVDTEEKKIAISFDAAWGADYTEELLEILREHNVKTTFFLVAFWVDKYPDMVKKIDESGHEIGNHSSSHPKMSQLSKEKIKEELDTTSGKIETITGKKVILFRPPFGDYNNTLMKTASDLGYYVIQWDVDSLDYKDYGTNAIVERVLSKVKNGSIVLFHNNATYTKSALPLILKSLEEKEYKIVPISELIHKEGFYIDHTGKQIKIDK